MRIVSGILMFVLLGVAGYAQQDAKVIAEIAASSEKAVKNSPFSADAVSESVQTLADGNRIVRSSTSKLYRNSEGSFRREMTGGSGGVLGSLFTVGQGVTIMDRAGGYRYMIDPNLKTTRQVMITPRPDVKVISGLDEKMKVELKAAAAASGATIEESVLSEKMKVELKAAAAASGTNTIEGPVLSDKLKAEIRTAVTAAPAIAARAMTAVGDGLAPVAMGFGTGGNSKWESRTEELGTQNIEGVDAEGSRTITTIPAGAIGNERLIEITYEKWYSRELQLVVMSKHNDPRFGEQTYRLTNIVRSEPDPSLFSPPNGYRLVTEPSGTFTYTSAAKAAAVEKAARSAQAAKARP